MKISKAQEQINKFEWENRDSWSTIYFSKKDTRACVPKRNPKHNWIINFCGRAGSRYRFKKRNTSKYQRATTSYRKKLISVNQSLMYLS